ncbi:jg886, partial [Pararge aegeria aegeria]
MRNSKSKTKTMWYIIRDLTSRNRQTDTKNITLSTQSGLVQEPQAVADIFNEFFISVGRSSFDDETCSENRNPYNMCNAQSRSINSLFLEPATEHEIHNTIRRLENKRSFGADEIPPILIKNCINELSSPLTFLINQSFNEGYCPDKLKIAKIRPILKKGGKPNDPSSYRPIALLPALSKIFEKTITNRVYGFLEKYNILNEAQYGFRKNRSTTLAVFKYIQEVLDCLEGKKYGVGL